MTTPCCWTARAGAFFLVHFEKPRADAISRNAEHFFHREAYLKKTDLSAQYSYLRAICYLTLSKPFYILDQKRLTT
jgi:hypothetical protein